ncbi:MAG: LamG-like jellyroll fold domain-containing protein [Myxococcota bacterium]|nr:LamG-like jellyroll fold domain-containing protein [Myxococcota bacterium]
MFSRKVIAQLLLAFAIHVFPFSTSYAQDSGGPDLAGYAWETIVHRMDTLSSGATGVSLGNDEVSNALPIGFTFPFYGRNYTQFYISSNGFITFLANQNHGCCSGPVLPQAGNPNGLIAGYWEDLNPSAGGQIKYEMLGSAPSRRMVVHFIDVPHNSNAATANFQIVLFEGRGDFEIRHQNSASNGGDHVIGYENDVGQDGLTIRNGDISLTNQSFRITANSNSDGPDTYGYSWTEVQGTPDTAINAHQLILGDDSVSSAVDIGFPFTFYGEEFSQLYVSSNGFVSFVSNQGNGCCNGRPFPNTANPDAIIAGYWGDLNPSAGGSIWYKLQGNAPNRKFILEFVNVPQAGGSYPVSFSVVLHEGRGNFEIQHRSCVARNDRAYYSTGFQNRDGSSGLSIRFGNFSSQGKIFRVDAPVGNSNNGGPDSYGYTWEQTAGNFNRIDAATGAIPVVLQDDQVTDAIGIGFGFTYYGVEYENVYISSNGFLSFLPNQPNGCCRGVVSPDTSGPNGIISGYWSDLNPSGGGTIDYQVLGNAPNREFVVQFNQIPHSGSNSIALVSFQIVLFENGSHFEIRFDNATSDGTVHSTGFENETGNYGLPIRQGNYNLQQITFRVTAPTAGGGPDAFGYRWFPIPTNSEDISNTNSLTLGDDSISDPLPLGFTFRYYGEEYSALRVGSNGFITFLDNQNQGCCSGVEFPNANSPDGLIAAYWEDLNPQAGGNIWYAERGNAPNRRFIVHFDQVPHSSNSGNPSSDLASFQIVLFEDGNNFEIRLLDVQSDGGTHATGFEDNLGQVGLTIQHGNYSVQQRSYRIIAPVQDAGGPDNFGYRWSATQFAYDDIQTSNGSGITLADDQISGAIPIGFPFSFYGDTKNQVYVSSNGFLSFDPTASAACCQRLGAPDSTLPNDIIAGFWGDLDPSAGGNIRYQTLGSTPNRQFVVQYTDIPHARSANTASFQIVLFEGSNDFEIRHLDCAHDGSSHVTGFEDAQGSNGLTIRQGTFDSQNTSWRIRAPAGATGGPDSVGYRWVVANHSFEDISNTNRITVTDDGMSSSINIGFDFVYYRRLYSRVFASPNGFISFLANQSGGCCAGRQSPDINNPNAVIAAYWEDLSPPTGGTLWHDTRGTAPNRRFIVQWQDVAHFGGGNEVTMQIVLYEGRGDFEIRIVNAPSDGGTHATGFENHLGTVGLPIAQGNFSLANRSYRVLAPEPNSAGGPYSTAEGQDIRLEGFCLGCTSYAWDFDGDGVFDDANGHNPVYSAAAVDGLAAQTISMRGCVTTNNCMDLTTTVLVTNVAPTITSSPPLFAGENQVYSYDAEASDPAGSLDDLSWTLVRGPPGMTINRVTGVVSYTGSIGNYPIIIRVSDDDGGQSEQSYNLQVISRGPDQEGYVWEKRPHSFATPPSSATSLTLTDELISDAVSLGFSFPFYGVDYTTARISSNGFITFAANQSTGCCSGQEFPAASDPNALIAGFWEDLDPSRGGSVKYHTDGSAPNRRFYVSFENVQHAGGGNPVTFQIVLHESTGDFEIRHQSCPSDGGNHSTGFEDPTGAQGLSIGYGNFSSYSQTWYITAPDNSGAGGPYAVAEGGTVTLNGSCNRNVCSSLDWDLDNNGQFNDAVGATPVFLADGYDGPSQRTIRLRACRQPTDCSTYMSTISIRNANPEFVSNPPTVVGRGEALSYRAVATDPARTGDPIVYELIAGPSGMQIETTGRLSWIANTTNTTESVTIRARDDDGGQIDQTFTINIEDRGPDDFGYSWSPTNHAWEDIEQTGANAVPRGDNRVGSAIPIGFTFRYYGAGYTDAYVSTNGFLTFLSGQSQGCCSGRRLPNTGSPNAIIAGYWEDLDYRSRGSIRYETLGTAPNRRFIVQFSDVPHRRHLNQTVTMQIVLFERSNNIELRYQDAQSDGGNHATGLENVNGRDGLTIRYGDYSLTNTTFRIDAPQENSAGGPYYVAEGGSITLFGQCSACNTFNWDFDNDLNFDDAVGATPTFDAGSLDGPIVGKKIALRACEPSGACTVLESTVDISNLRPTIISQPNTTVAAGDPYIYRAVATDPANNNGQEGDPITWSLIRGPNGMNIHPSRGFLVWNNTTGFDGPQRVQIRATDGDGGRHDQTFWLNVVNRGPDNFGYTWEEVFFSWEDISSSGTRLNLGGNSVSSAIPIGFDFLYYGRDFSTTRVASNGFLSFLSGQGSGCCSGASFPNTNNPNAVIAGYWVDLEPRRGTVHYQTLGSAPNRRFIVQYSDVPHRGPNTHPATFQIVLFEGKGDFEIRHRLITRDTGITRAGSTGFENHNGTDGLVIRRGNITSRDTAWKVFAPTTPEITTAEFTPVAQPERVDFTVAAATPSQWTIQLRHVPRTGRCEDETGTLIAHRVYTTRTSTNSTIGGLAQDTRYCWYAKASSRAQVSAERGVRIDGLNEYMEVADDASLDFTGSFSMSTWIWIDSYPANGRFVPLIAKSHSSEAQGVYSIQLDSNGQAGLMLSDGNSAAAIRSGWTSPLTVGSWHNITSVYDRLAGTASIYVNGSLATTGNWSETVAVSDRSLTIGQGKWGAYDQYFHGTVDDTALWNRALTGTEIATVYNSGTPPDLQRQSTSSGLVSWWTMGDAPSDDSTADSGRIADLINGQNATPRNMEASDIIVFDASTGGGTTRIESGVLRTPALPQFSFDSPRTDTPTLGAVIITATTTADATAVVQHTSAVPCQPASSAAHFNGNNISTLIGDIVKADQFSIEAWIRPEVPNQSRQILSARDGNIRLSLVDGRFRFEVTTSQGLRQLDSPNRIPEGYDTHFAVTKSPTELRLYINGVRVNNSRHSGLVEGELPRLLDVILGGEANSGFVGLISSLAIYYRAISTTEISRHVSIGPNIELTPLRFLTGNWYFQEADGVQSLYENSGTQLAGVRGRHYGAESVVDSGQFDWENNLAMFSSNPRNHHRYLGGLQQGYFYCYRVVATIDGKQITTSPRSIRTTEDRFPPTITADANVSVECSGNANDIGFGQVVRMFPGATSMYDSAVVGFVNTPVASDDYDQNPTIRAYTEDVGTRTPITEWFQPASNVSCSSHADCGTDEVCDAGRCAAHPEPSRFILGNNPIIWVATDDAGNEGIDNSTVIVRDTIPPEVVGGPDLVRQASNPAGTPLQVNPQRAVDICDNDLDIDGAPPTFQLGNTTVNFTVRDNAGNVGRASRNVIIVDTTGPTFEGTPPLPETTIAHNDTPETTLPGCFQFIPPTPTVSDNGYPENELTVELSGTPDCWNLGSNGENQSYTVTWTARDPAGNETVQTQVFNVVRGTIDVIHRSSTSRNEEIVAGKFYNAAVTTVFDLCAGNGMFELPEIRPAPDLPIQDLGAPSGPGLGGCNRYSATFTREGNFANILVLALDTSGGIGSGTIPGFGIDLTGPVILSPILDQTDVVLTDPATYPYSFNGELLDLSRIIAADGAWEPTALSSAVDFAGRQQDAEVVTIPFDAAATGLGNTLSVEAWVRPGQQNAGTILSKALANNESSFSLVIRDGHVDFSLTTDQRSRVVTSENIVPPFAAANAGWHHIAGVYTGKSLRLYIDANPIAQKSLAGPVALDNSPIQIGPGQFNGSVSNVVFNKDAVNSEDLRNRYRGGVGRALVPTANTFGLYRFNRNGQIVEDSSGKNNHGQLGTDNTQENNEPEKVALTQPLNNASSGMDRTEVWLVPDPSQSATSSIAIIVEQTPVTGTPLAYGQRLHGGLVCGGSSLCSQGKDILEIERIRSWNNVGDSPYRLAVHAVDAAGNRTIKEIGLRTQTYETGLRSVIAQMDNFANDPTSNVPTELQDAQVELRVALSYAEQTRPYDDGSYLRNHRAIQKAVDAASMEDGLEDYPARLARGMFADIRRYHTELNSIVAVRDQPIFDRASELLEEASFDARIGRWMQVGNTAREAYDEIALLHADFVQLRSRWLEVRSDWNQAMQNLATNPGYPLESGVRRNPQRLLGVIRMITETRNVLKNIVHNEISLSLSNPFTTQRRSLEEIMDVIDKGSSSDPDEQGDLISISDVAVTDACLDVLADPNGRLADDVFARCYLRLNDMAQNLGNISEALVHTHRWRAAMALALFNMLEVTMYASDTGLPWVTSNAAIGTNPPLVLPDAEAANVPGTTPLSTVDRPDGALANAYQKYNQAVALLDAGDVDGTFNLFVQERCLLLKLYNRYYSTSNLLQNVADPKEMPIDPVTVGCSN